MLVYPDYPYGNGPCTWFYTRRRKMAYSIYGVMLFAFLVGVCINVSQEMGGNPRIDEMGIAQDNGAMEGKEVRLGSAATALWSIVTTVTSNGSVMVCMIQQCLFPV